MSSPRVVARTPRGALRRPPLLREASLTATYLQDAARTPFGHTPLVASPADEGEIAWTLREAKAVLAIGAQSSLTGGATPFGEWVLRTARLDATSAPRAGRVRVQAGVALRTLREELHAHGAFYPPMPTWDGAFVGGSAATNAAGAATFKYGSTRDWVEGLSVVLANGEVLDLERGRCRAEAGWFEIVGVAGETLRVNVPRYSMPRVEKRSAGYYAEPGMDLVDLFLGSEGTLGVITDVELRVLPEPARLLCWLPLDSEAAAVSLAGRLREAARATWSARDPRGVDVAAIESLDRRSLELLREDGADRANGLPLAPSAQAALFFTLELREADVLEAEDSPLDRLERLIAEWAPPEALIVAPPGDSRRARQLEALREAVPLAVNHRVERAQRADPGVHKVAADMCVPFERLPEAIALYRDGFARRGLDPVIFGHVSDGNLHANAIPMSADDVEAGQQAILEFGTAVIAMGGCPMSEHGVGRNRVKQELLARLYGPQGIDEMRAVKAALDPAWKLAPGVLFPPPSAHVTAATR